MQPGFLKDKVKRTFAADKVRDGWAGVKAATTALEAWPGYASTPLLLGLCDVLKAQVASLRPSA